MLTLENIYCNMVIYYEEVMLWITTIITTIFSRIIPLICHSKIHRAVGLTQMCRSKIHRAVALTQIRTMPEIHLTLTRAIHHSL